MSLNRTPPSKAKSASSFASLTLPESNLQHHTGSDSALDSITTRGKCGKRKYMSEEETSMRYFIQEIKSMFYEFAKDQNNKIMTLQSTVSTIKEENEEISLSLSFLSQKYDEMRDEINLLKNKQKDSEKYTNILENKIELLERKMKINEVEIRNIPKMSTKETNQELHKIFQMVIHSDYKFGDCKRPDIRLYAHVHKGHMDVLGKIIIREWLKIPRIPTCIVLRARSFEEDLFRSTAYNFQMCVPRIVYCHSRKRFKYFFYEWYIPSDMVGGMDWDIYFYGPIAMDWQ